jgi:hypothetical protein
MPTSYALGDHFEQRVGWMTGDLRLVIFTPTWENCLILAFDERPPVWRQFDPGAAPAAFGSPMSIIHYSL